MQSARYVVHPLDCQHIDLAAAQVRLLTALRHEVKRANRHLASTQNSADVYVGIAGAALMSWRVSALQTLPKVDSVSIRKAADDALASAICCSPLSPPRKGSRTSFLETSVGPATLVLLRLVSAQDNYDLFTRECYDICVQTLQVAVQIALTSDTLTGDGCEVLYGRAGLLYALLLLRSGFDDNRGTMNFSNGQSDDPILQKLQDLASDSTLSSIVKDIVERGEVGAEDSFGKVIVKLGSPTPPLMWSWHGKMYLGAAHGVAGILKMLVSCPINVVSPFLPKILVTVEWLVNRQGGDGNWPTKANSEVNPDALLQWCHGAPGVVILLTTLLLRSKQLNVPHPLQDKIKACVMESSKLIYERGLLTKGVGLCHGIAGCVFALLCASDVLDSSDGPLIIFPQAVHLAAMAIQWRKMTDKGEMKVPDHPYSLFEGLAGMCVAWVAILERLGPDGNWRQGSLGFPGFDDLDV